MSMHILKLHTSIILISSLFICHESMNANWTVKSEAVNNGPYPLVMIPGTAGSQAFALFKDDSDREPLPLWLNMKFFVFLKRFSEYFMLHYDSKTGRTRDTEGVEVIFPGWGETWSIENLDETPNVFSEYFGPLVYILKKDSFYVSNFTIRGAPYDFRKAPNENDQFFDNLKILIEETYENAKQRPVVLHPHSMGCLYAMAFLKKRSVSWKRKYIKSVIFSSCPFGGSVKSLKVEASGDNFGVFLRSPLSFRNVQRSMPSLTFMFPDSRLWSSSEPLIITPTTNYTTADYERFFTDINYTIGNSGAFTMKFQRVAFVYFDQRSYGSPEKGFNKQNHHYAERFMLLMAVHFYFGDSQLHSYFVRQ